MHPFRFGIFPYITLRGMEYHLSNSSEYPELPRVAVGAIVFHEDRILLVLRGKPPAEGLWSIPGGSVELGETLQEAAEREIYEETDLVIRAGEPVFTFDSVDRDDKGDVRFHYVIIDLIADYVSGSPRAGDDALDAGWFTPEELKNMELSPMTRRLCSAVLPPNAFPLPED